MSPILEKIVVDGASRHRLHKGFILRSTTAHPIQPELRDTVIQRTMRTLSQNIHLAEFSLSPSPLHPALLSLDTPFYPIYSMNQRNIFIQRLSSATKNLIQIAEEAHCEILAAGVNPLENEGEQPLALCADIHEIEVFDDGEVERIYNLYRQYLPELLAISTHSAVYNGKAQSDHSLRMRVNAASFLPRYLSQFSGQHLKQLERMMRKDYGLGDIRLMDVNPLGGSKALLQQKRSPVLSKQAASVEVRFIDAQCSLAFIRAQMLFLQAIAMYGRTLARLGKRLPYMDDNIIDENKALAIKGGADAVLKPDAKMSNDDTTKGYSHHHKGKTASATDALLMIINGVLLPSLQDLECEYWELQPILLGAELRNRGLRCFANYAEYQQYLCNAQKQQFANALQMQTNLLLSNPSFDIISDYNRQLHMEQARTIETVWEKKLTASPSTPAGQKSNTAASASHSPKASTPPAGQKPKASPDISPSPKAPPLPATTVGQKPAVSSPKAPPPVTTVGQKPATPPRKVLKGIIVALDKEGKNGQLKDGEGNILSFASSAMEGPTTLYIHDRITFELSQASPPDTSHIHLQPRKQGQGIIRWYDPTRYYGIITQTDGSEVYFHSNDVMPTTSTVREGISVHYQVVEAPEARNVRLVQIQLKGERK